MNFRTMAVVWVSLVATAAGIAGANDWPQWRGANRDAKVTGFQSPAAWPQTLVQKWKVSVGDGVATPALVGDRLYVFSRQDANEVIQCLDTASGKPAWENKYEAEDATGAAANFPVPGPRSSPAVAEGKIVTVGTRGTISCLNAANGDKVWRKDEFHAWPRFFASSSPIIVNGLCIACLGGDREGAIVAYDLATGNEKWKWAGDGPAYASPVSATIGGTNVIIAPMAEKLVAVGTDDGKLLWEMSYSQGRYNAATPIVDGETVIFAGPSKGITAQKLVKKDDKLAAEPVWSNGDNSVMYDTPVLKNGLLFGLSNLDSLFCINVTTGKTTWNASVSKTSNTDAKKSDAEADKKEKSNEAKVEEKSDEGKKDGDRKKGRGERGGRRGMGRRGMGAGGYGSIVDAGDVLFALTPAAELIVFKPNEQAYTEVARYKVADGMTYSYPVVSGNRVYIKDKNSIALWTLE